MSSHTNYLSKDDINEAFELAGKGRQQFRDISDAEDLPFFCTVPSDTNYTAVTVNVCPAGVATSLIRLSLHFQTPAATP